MKTLDLLSGIGGFSYGLEQVGFKTVAFCEMDKYCKLVLQKHWKGVKIYNDVKELKGEEIIKEHGTIDLVTGGFPCQPFSIAGSRKGTNDNRHLWPEMFRIIKELKPRWIIGENVRNIISIQDGMVFENVCTDLEGEGYEVRAFNIPAAGIGAPHKRERIWIVANSRRTLRERSKFQGENANEGEQENAYQYQRSSSTSTDNVANTESIESYVGEHRKHQTKGNRQSETRGKSSEDVANTHTRLSNGSIEEVQSGRQTFDTSSERVTDVAYTYSQRQQEQCRPKSIQEERNESKRSSSQEGHTGWESEPDVGRVAHGLSGRVHRLKALGNSIVPKIAEEIGRAIMIAESEDDNYQSGGAYKAMLKLFRNNL
jgi:DNA (cytosine-5)-methyltransferase 1